MKLRYTLPALAELNSILDYIAAHSPRGAKRVQRRLQSTLSALLQTDRHGPGLPVVAPDLTGTASYPAIPIRDLVPFPTATYPLFVGREKTIQALNQAFERRREVVIAIQRQSGIDEPGLEDVYEIGVVAQLLEIERLHDGTLKVLTQVRRRVAIRSNPSFPDGVHGLLRGACHRSAHSATRWHAMTTLGSARAAPCNSA